ncbi:unnamed protein product [Ilex paraguariensis]|uniref:Uncharacterized protein n=1 Tax=Ilex paraguariensis TaxID=185542 RepID=A0ABC8QVW3_9AQUA
MVVAFHNCLWAPSEPNTMAASSSGIGNYWFPPITTQNSPTPQVDIIMVILVNNFLVLPTSFSEQQVFSVRCHWYIARDDDRGVKFWLPIAVQIFFPSSFPCSF